MRYGQRGGYTPAEQQRRERWLRIYRMPAYAPELNPGEGIWSLLKRAIANFAARGLDHLVRIRQTQAEEDPIPAPPDHWLPHSDRPDHRSLMITQALRGQPWGYAMSSSDHEVKLTVKALGHQRLADHDVGRGDQPGE